MEQKYNNTMEQKYLSWGEFEDEWEIHKRLAKTCKKGIVEIGVLAGQTTRMLLENSTITVYGIDPIIPDSMNSQMIGDLEKINQLESEFDRFTFIKDYSYNVIKGWNTEFDYIFIDGDHNYSSVKDDFDSWFPFLTEGGYVAIHDSACNRGGPYWWPGPSRLADELINDERLEYIETVFSLTLFKKIK
jgi:hypothetical protein